MGPTDSAFLRLRGDINVTPLIDVLLVLFVVFLLLQHTRHVMPVQLPPVRETGQSAAGQPGQIVLQLSDDGSYAINGAPVPLAVLARRLSELYLERPVKLLFVQAAPGRSYGEVMDAVDLARGAGVQVVGFAPYGTRPGGPD
jgi:biopolymer transport protein ExbD